MRGPVVKSPELYLLITSTLIVCLYSHAMTRFTHERERERERENYQAVSCVLFMSVAMAMVVV